MAVEGKTLAKHPGRNPDYEAGMRARREAQAYNRKAGVVRKVRVPKQPNKYIPHQGKKESARYGK